MMASFILWCVDANSQLDAAELVSCAYIYCHVCFKAYLFQLYNNMYKLHKTDATCICDHCYNGERVCQVSY